MKKTHIICKHQKHWFLIMLLLVSCEILDNDPDKHVGQDKDSTFIALDEVARILSAIPINTAQLQEVHDAVTSSSGNGYDEEYTMRDLFESPGFGVGDSRETRSAEGYERPMRELIIEYVNSSERTRAGMMSEYDGAGFLDALAGSDVQIYWPYSEEWDGKTMPVVTFDPEDDVEENIGFEFIEEDDGFRHVREIVVDEEMAKERPVWVVNRNSDAGFTSLEMLRREDPEWGDGGGSIIVKPHHHSGATRTDRPMNMLVLKDFTMRRQFDSWFCGAAEFFVKISSLDDFTATTEAELRLYNPQITDFMIVVKRNQIGIPQPSNVVLVSDIKDEVEEYAFMITEDDGGTITEWKSTALVRIASKSYGVEINLPFNSRDDVVWRGQLTSRWFEANSNVVGHFGDVDMTFEVVEY